MRVALTLAATLCLLACASQPAPDQEGRPTALFVGKVESAEYIATLQDVMPYDEDSLWHGEIYELRMKVLDRLSGGPVGKTVTVRVTGHARRFTGMTLAVLSDPHLAFYNVNIGTSWWEDLSPESPMLCVPDHLLEDPAFATFVARAKAVDDSRCLEIR
jgi:hypothetical protein